MMLENAERFSKVCNKRKGYKMGGTRAPVDI